MKFKDEKIWNSWVEANKDDGYGRGVLRFAERWADTMEREIENGHSLGDIAQRACEEADDEGITGFMYGCAVSMLSQAWVYGDELRVWSNNTVAMNPENAEQANREGKVLNPALLSLSIP